MAQQHVTRKLAAILAADVAGYSRLMGEDEEGTLRTLNAFRAVIDGLIVEHEGRVFGSAGDSVIAEFVSPVEAVRCATEIQRDLETRNTDLPEDRRMQFRIGVNLGDVMVESDDLFGDGVNVAARLETLAEPGGICLSRSIFDQVKKQLDLGYEYLGEQRVKNIAEPVRVYRVLLEPGAAGQVLGEARPAAPRWRIVAAAIAVVVLVGVAGAVAWLRPWAPDVGPVSVERTALPLPDKPSIAVLPFANVSDDPEQEYFADGMTDDLITDLSKISGLFVIARNSVFTYKGKPVKVQKVSEELGVRYVLEGSVRRAGGRVRINAQLIDATTGRHLWAERFGRDYTDIFTLQDEVVGRIVAALAVELTDAEQRQIARLPTDNLEAYDYYLRAERLGYGYGGMRANALSFYQKAIALDQKFADAYAGDARVAVDVWRFDIASVLPGPVALTRAYEAASRALALDPDNARAYSVLGIIQIVDGRHDNAIDSVRKAVSLDPNDAEAYTYLASVLTYAGRHSEALAAMETAFRLNPKPPPYFYGDLGWVLFWNRQYEKAIGPLAKARAGGVAYLETLAMTYAQLGRLQDARAEVDRILERVPFANLAYYRVLYAHHKREEDLEHRLDSLRKAGIPEWPFDYEGRVEDRLDEPAIRSLTFGRTWIGQFENGTSFVQENNTDGRIAFQSPGFLRTGTVWVEGGMLCNHFPASLVSRKQCSYVYRNPDGTPGESNEYVVVSPTSILYFSVRP